MTIEEPTTWQDKVQAELSQLGNVLWNNFKHASQIAMQHAPDQLDVKQRSIVWGFLVESWIGGMVVSLATYGSDSPQFEDMVIAEVRHKFKWIREHGKELAMQRLEQIAKAREEKTGLVLAPSVKE